LVLVSFFLLLCTACSSSDDEGERIIPTMSMTVTDIEDGCATLSSEQLTGTTYGAKVLRYYPIADIGIDYNIEVKLVKFVEDNGEAVTLPYHETITEGLRPGTEYISAIIAYNAEGRAVCSAFQTWKASGTEGMWSDNNNAGSLDKQEW
jgi:hypothetical protein